MSLLQLKASLSLSTCPFLDVYNLGTGTGETGAGHVRVLVCDQHTTPDCSRWGTGRAGDLLRTEQLCGKMSPPIRLNVLLVTANLSCNSEVSTCQGHKSLPPVRWQVTSFQGPSRHLASTCGSSVQTVMFSGHLLRPSPDFLIRQGAHVGALLLKTLGSDS